jgi:lysozyme family protein
MTDFNQAVVLILKAEGGYSNDPNDPGGETQWGISKRTYPNLDIKNLTIDGAREIYKRDYWDKVKGDEITWPLNLYLFDAAVNQGVQPAITMLQKALSIQQDGILGNNTLSAIKKQSGVATSFMAERAMRYTGTRSFDIYGRGWFKRLFQMVEGK